MKNRVKEFRKEKQMRQEDFAKILGVTRQTIIAIENNKYNPTLELYLLFSIAMKISRFLGFR